MGWQSKGKTGRGATTTVPGTRFWTVHLILSSRGHASGVLFLSEFSHGRTVLDLLTEEVDQIPTELTHDVTQHIGRSLQAFQRR